MLADGTAARNDRQRRLGRRDRRRQQRAPTPPTPAPQDNEKSWTISAADFRDDGSNNIYSETSNRSEPYAWDRITGDDVRVSIGGNKLPFTSTRYQPVFESDISGATWTVTQKVDAGAVVLTALDQTYSLGEVAFVTMTDGGAGYTSVPTVTFSASGGTTATGTAILAPERGNDRYQNLYWARQTLYGKQLLVQVGSGSE